MASTQQTTQHRSGITFAVDPVTPAETAMPQCKTHEAIKNTVVSGIESCSDYSGQVVDGIWYQPLLAAVYTAFSQHRPLVLSPDAVWITIAQGVAHHMAIHGERLRHRFVAHEGKLELTFEVNDWVAGSPENPWPEAFAAWTEQIREHVGAPLHDVLVCDFSTSGPLERAVSQIVMMDIFERYFEYVVVCVCGIPAVTLEGEPEDWQRLADKVAGLRVFDCDWWLDHLQPICDQFARASRGDVDLKHWQAICKVREEYGGDIINGWVAMMFPYLRPCVRGACTKRNPIFETGEGFTTWDAPSGLSMVPFIWRIKATGEERPMEAIGGLVGMTQDPQTLALRPTLGWAVRPAGKMDVLLARVAKDHARRTGVRPKGSSHLPTDLMAFYHRTNGASLFGRGQAAAVRIVAHGKLEPLDWGEVSESLRKNSWPNGHLWYRLAWLADGSCIAMNPSPSPDQPESMPERYRAMAEDFLLSRSLAAYCHCEARTQGQPGKNPVVALTFTELLERLLASEGKPYWLDPKFENYGDAELYTRRQ